MRDAECRRRLLGAWYPDQSSGTTLAFCAFVPNFLARWVLVEDSGCDKRASWRKKMYEDEQDEQDDGEGQNEHEETSHPEEAHLELHLSDELIEQVRARLESLK